MSTAYALAASSVQAQRGHVSPGLRVRLQAAVLSAGGAAASPRAGSCPGIFRWPWRVCPMSSEAAADFQ